MDADTFDTRSLPLAQQFEAWSDWYGSVFDTMPRRSVSLGYEARNLTWRLDGFALSRVAAPAIDGIRSRANIQRNPVDHWVITVTTRGTHKVLARGTVVEPGVGVPLVQSLADPMASTRSDYDRVQLYLARDDFFGMAGIMDAVRDIPLQTEGGRLLAEYLFLLERNLPSLPSEEAQRLKDAVRAMVAACIAPTAGRVAEATVPIRASRMELVRRTVERHLRAPTLGTSLICREVGISRTQLYRLLENEGGVTRYIQHKRLAAAHAELCDPTNQRSISEICYDLGFSDASVFNRAFRREFGFSPSDVRAGPYAIDLRAGSARSAQAQANTFGDLIRYL